MGRLNDLPDDVLCLVLSNLSTKDSIRSSVLSKRWRNLWLYVPVLDLDSNYFADTYDFVEFINKFLVDKHKQDIEKFKIVFDYYKGTYTYSDDTFLDVWIDELVKHNVYELYIKTNSNDVVVLMPYSFYSFKTLVSLSLSRVDLMSPWNVVISMPCVKTMYLDEVRFDRSVLETLISSSPVLEDLTIIRDRDPEDDYLEDVIVRSSSLKRFILRTDHVEYSLRTVMDHTVEIDAPRLERMSLFDHLSGSVTIHNIAPFALVIIDVSFDEKDGNSSNLSDDDVDEEDGNSLNLGDDDVDGPGRTMIRNFLTAISEVSVMKISSTTLKVIHDYSRMELLPQFSNLSRLQATFLESSWELLPIFLACCPNLHTLLVEFDSFTETKPSEILYVPTPCFVSSLEFVRLKTPVLKKPSSQMRLATYFLRNCAVLRELSLSESFSKVIKRIEKIQRKSKRCNIFMG